MRWAAVVVGLVAGAGCDGGPPELSRPVQSVFDTDVEVHSWGVRVWFREQVPPCDPEEVFPHPGECVSYTDGFGCNGDLSATCLTRVAIERDGVSIGEAPGLEEAWHHVSVAVAGGGEPYGAAVVIEGCGDEASIPLPAEPAPAVTLTDLATDGVYLRGAWTSDGAPTGVVGSLYSTFAGEACHDATGEARARALYPEMRPQTFSATAVIEGDAMPTPWGQAQVWNLGPTRYEPVILPTDRRWVLSDESVENAVIDIEGHPIDRGLGLWSFGSGGAGMVLDIGTSFPLDWHVHYEAGDTTDTVRLRMGTAAYSATIPHVVPSDPVEESFDGNRTFALAVGPVTLTSETDPTVTRPSSFSVRWDHPVLPHDRSRSPGP